MKRILEIFRGVRNLNLTNDESFGDTESGRARRAERVGEQKTIDQFYGYTAIIGHKDVAGKHSEFKVLWANGDVSWVDAQTFLRDVVRSEGSKNNVIVRYDKDLAARAKRAAAEAQSAHHAQRWIYEDIRNHKDDSRGNRSEYEVVWKNGQTSWEPVSQFRADVVQAEGTRSNVITVYEERVKQADRQARASAIKKPTISQAREFATWVQHTEALEINKEDRPRADARLAVLPRVPSLLPWSVRSPLTTAAGRMKMHDLLLYAKHWAPLHLRGLLQESTAEVILAYFDFIARLTARTMTKNETVVLEAAAGVVLSELELVLPVTEFTILVHALVHVPKQLAWFGPACTTWMFAFERYSTIEQYKKSRIWPDSGHLWACCS